MKTELTAAEKETIIRFSEEEDVLYIYTASRKMFIKFKKLGYRLVKEDMYGGFFEAPLNLLKFTKGYRVSEQDRQKRSQRMNDINRKKQTVQTPSMLFNSSIKLRENLGVTPCVGTINLPTDIISKNYHKFMRDVEIIRAEGANEGVMS